jgi:hypothetical protein
MCPLPASIGACDPSNNPPGPSTTPPGEKRPTSSARQGRAQQERTGEHHRSEPDPFRSGVGRARIHRGLRRGVRRTPYSKIRADVDANFLRFRSQVRKATFRSAFSRAADGEPVGIAYGYALSPRTGWWNRLTTPVTEDMCREGGQRTFGLIELAVRRPWRRLGLAWRLHQAVLA